MDGNKSELISVETQELVNSRLSYEYADKKALTAKSKYSVSELGHAEFLSGQASEQGRATLASPASGQRSATLPAGREKAAAVPLFIQGKKKLTGAEIGAAIHVVMEKLDFREASEMFALSESEGYAYLSGLIEELKEKVILTPDAADAVNLKRIEMFIKSDIGKRAAKADKIYKETPFNIMKEIDGIETIVQGVIDCWFEEGGEYVMIDYKSGYITGDEDIMEFTKFYEGQLLLYAEALEMIKNVKVKEKYLYLFAKDTAVLSYK